MNKTAREWFKELPPRIEELANDALTKQKIDNSYTYKTLEVALYIAFDWYETSEGFDYWQGVYDDLIQRTIEEAQLQLTKAWEIIEYITRFESPDTCPDEFKWLEENKQHRPS